MAATSVATAESPLTTVPKQPNDEEVKVYTAGEFPQALWGLFSSRYGSLVPRNPGAKGRVTIREQKRVHGECSE